MAVRFLKIFLSSLVLLTAALTFMFLSQSKAILNGKANAAVKDTLAPESAAETEEKPKQPSQNEIRDARIREKAEEALEYCKLNGCSTEFCILIDMKIHSGKHRMFVYNFSKQEVEHKALAAHGIGKEEAQSTYDEPLFSNEPGSNLSSLGKYLTGKRDYSNWGINVHYKMHGQDSTNSNAFRRVIVLHSYSLVSTYEIYPNHLPLGWSQGCPVTDDDTMTYLDLLLQDSNKPMLIWIYY